MGIHFPGLLFLSFDFCTLAGVLIFHFFAHPGFVLFVRDLGQDGFVGLGVYKLFDLVVLLLLQYLQLRLELLVLFLKQLHLFDLVLSRVLVFLKRLLQLGIFVLPHAEVFHQILYFVLMIVRILDPIQRFPLLKVLQLKFFNRLLQLLLLSLTRFQLLLEFDHVFTFDQFLILCLQFVNLDLVVFDLFLGVLDFFVSDLEEVLEVLLALVLLLGQG